MKDTENLAAVLNNIANIYQLQDRQTQALNLFRQALGLSEDNEDYEGKAAMLNNIVGIHEKQLP